MGTITVYNDVILPASVVLAAGLQGRNKRANDRGQSGSGQKSVNVRQSRTLREYEFGVRAMHIDIWQTIEGLFEVTDAGVYGFLMEDPKDIAILPAAGKLYPYGTTLQGAIGLGYGVPTYRLYKRYTAIGGTRSRDRRITRPQATPVLLRGGSPVTLGASAGNAAINYDTGLVTFVADTSQAVASVTTGPTPILNFANGAGIVAAMSVGQRVYLSGLAGAGASDLNGLSHEIIAKGATSLTIVASLGGLITIGTGTAYKYPQASESLTWSGRMYIPVHFANDVLDWDLMRPDEDEDNRLFAGPSIVLAEVPE